MSLVAGFSRHALRSVHKPTYVPNTAFKVPLGFYAIGTQAHDLVGNATAYARMAKFDWICFAGMSASSQAADVKTAVAGIRAARAAAGGSRQQIGFYLNAMEIFAARIKSITRTGTNLAVVFDDLNGDDTHPATVGVAMRIFGCSEPLYNYSVAGALACTAVGGSTGAFTCTLTIPGGAGANVTNSLAVAIKDNQTTVNKERIEKVANEGWFIADHSDADTAGDWGVWGGDYGTLSVNFSKWAPKDSSGQDYPAWFVAQVGAGFYDFIADDPDAFDFFFLDNLFGNGPGEFFGDNNGNGDFKRVGSNQKCDANTAEGREVRNVFRDGYKRVGQLLQARYPGNTLIFGNLNEKPASYATHDNDQFRGWLDGSLQEFMIRDAIATAANYSSEQGDMRTVAANLNSPRQAVYQVAKSSGGMATLETALLIRGMAFWAMGFISGEDAPTLAPKTSNDDTLADGTTAWNDVLDTVLGEPIEDPLTAPSGASKGNGTSNDGAALWRRAFEHAILVSNPSASPATCYPPIGLWQSYTGGGAIGGGGISVPADGAVLLVPV